MIHQSKNATAPHTSGPESANMKHAPSRAARRPSALILRADAMTDFGALRDLPVGLHIVSADGHIVDANPAACALFGLERQKLLGGALTDFAANAQPAVRAPDLDVGQIRILRPDGTTRDLEYSSAADFCAGRRLLVLMDVTERKAGE